MLAPRSLLGDSISLFQLKIPLFAILGGLSQSPSDLLPVAFSKLIDETDQFVVLSALSTEPTYFGLRPQSLRYIHLASSGLIIYHVGLHLGHRTLLRKRSRRGGMEVLFGTLRH